MSYTWSLVNPGITLNGASAAWLGNKFVVLGYGSTDAVTSTDTVAWTAHTLPVSANWVAYPAVASGNLCTVGYGSNISLYGNDVDGWTQGTLPATANWSAVAVKPGTTSIFVAISSTNGNAARSTNGSTWTSVASAAPAACYDIKFGGGGAGYFLAVTATAWAKSADGTAGTWTTGSLPYANTRSLGWNGSVWVALSSTGHVATSPDGETWTGRGQIDATMGSGWFNLLVRGTEFLAFRDNTGTVAINGDNGVTWPISDDGAGTGNYWYGVACNTATKLIVATNNNILVGVGSNSLGGSTSVNVGVSVSDGIATAETLTPTQLARLIENLRLTGSITGRVDAHRALADDVQFADAMQVVWRMLLAENLITTGTASEQVTRLAAIVDVLHATGVLSARLDAKAAVVEALALSTLLATGWKATVSESLAFQDALTSALRVAASLVDGIDATDLPSPSLRLLATHTDSLGLDDSPTTQLSTLAKLSEDVLFYAVLRLGDAEYVGWVLNEGAPSQYTNYPFNGFVCLDGGTALYVGTADDGVYLLEGNDDAGTDITASIKTALMDFGSGVLKRMPEVLIAFAGGDQVVCKVITTHPRTGAQIESIYTASVPPGAALHNAPIKPGQGLTSRYWQFALSEFDELDELTFRPLFLDRRI